MIRRSIFPKVIALIVAGLCVSCSSPGQSVQNTVDVKEMAKQALSVGIETTGTKLVSFYVVNNTATDVSMLAWNTPFETTLSADIFSVVLDGKSMTYLGRKVKRSNPKVSDYMLVPAGERLESAMDIAKFYDFSEAGEYAVTINLPEIDGVAMLNQETSVTIDSGSLNIVGE